MTKISAVEQNRLTHINHLINEVQEATMELYEKFIDKEYDAAKIEVKNLINRLKDVQESLEDEI